MSDDPRVPFNDEEEVSEEHATHSTPAYGTYETDDEFEEPEDRVLADTKDRMRKLLEKVLRDFEEIKEIMQWLHSGKSTDDKEIETADAKMHELKNKLERDKKEWEENFESVDPIGFNEFKIGLLRAHDKLLSNDSAASRDEISTQIEALQQDIEHIKDVYEKEHEKYLEEMEEELEEARRAILEADSTETIGDMIEEVEEEEEES